MTAGFYFLIILLGLILCSFLGGYKEGMFGVSQGNINTKAYFTPEPSNTFTGANQNNKGAVAYYSNNGDGSYTVITVDIDGKITGYTSNEVRDKQYIKEFENEFKPGSPNMKMFASSNGYLSIIHIVPGLDYVLINNSSDTSLPSGYIGQLMERAETPIIQPASKKGGSTSGSTSQPTQGSVTFGNTIASPVGASTNVSTATNPGIIPILASFLYNQQQNQNYNHYTGTSLPTLFYSPNGSKATLINANNTISISITYSSGTTIVYSPSKPDSTGNMIYIADDKTSIKIISDNYGNPLLQQLDSYGNPLSTFSSSKTYTMNPNFATNSASPQQPFNLSNYFNGYNRQTSQGGSYPPSYIISPDGPSLAYPAPTAPVTINSMNGDGQYNNWLPRGISKSMIPPGDEDLYILKSSVVPPVCPSCPAPIVAPPTTSSSSKTDTSNCPACPPCARCPEPAFTCQKVPNYARGANNSSLPSPMTGSGYTTYGM